MSDQETPNMIMWSKLLVAYRALKQAKPNDRSEEDRRYAVAITKYEELLGWYYTMVLMEFVG